MLKCVYLQIFHLIPCEKVRFPKIPWLKLNLWTNQNLSTVLIRMMNQDFSLKVILSVWSEGRTKAFRKNQE